MIDRERIVKDSSILRRSRDKHVTLLSFIPRALMVKTNAKKMRKVVTPPIAKKKIAKRKQSERKESTSQIDEEKQVKIKGVFPKIPNCGSRAKKKLMQNLK